MDLDGIHCRLNALKCIRPMSFSVQIMCVGPAQNVTGITAFGRQWLYIEIICSLSIMTVWILHIIVEYPMTVCLWPRWASRKHQRFSVWLIWQSQGSIVTSIQRGSIGCLYNWKCKRHAPCPNLEMSFNWASRIFGLALWIITGLCNCTNS